MASPTPLQRQEFLLRRALSKADSWLSVIDLKSSDLPGIALLVLYARIMDLSMEFLDAYASRLFNAVAFLCRVQLEAYADLLNLIKDEGYVDNIHASSLKTLVDIANSAQRGNPFLESVLSRKNFNENKEKYKQELDDLKKKDRKPLRPMDRLIRAELDAVYGAIYPDLSDNIHNNMNLLEKRHVDDVAGKLHITVRKGEQDDSEWICLFDLVIRTLVVSTTRVHQKRETSAQGTAEQFEISVNEECKEIQKTLA